MAINPQFIKAPDGSELVVITRAEFDALVNRFDEDEEEAAIFDARIAELRANEAETLPQEITQLMLNGDSLLKALRKWRDQTQLCLESKTGLSQSYISDLESGKKQGTPETLRKIAAALQIEPKWLGV
ncbi:MAG TPA: helix-turn-helix transcriptional regulator [Roseiarcus sp.]|nr:helix-turn-helix transcriptional regulator [Roseiarcus sp.]